MDIGKGISQSFDIYVKNIGVLLVAVLVTVFISGITLGILAGPLFGGLLVLCLKLILGEKGEIGEIFAHFDKFVPTLLLTLLIGIPVCIVSLIPILGMIVLFFACPILSLVYSSALIMIIEKNMDFMEALKQAYGLFKPNIVLNWLYVFVIDILASVGAILCGVGIILTMPIGPVAMALAYRELSGSAEAPPTSVSPTV